MLQSIGAAAVFVVPMSIFVAALPVFALSWWNDSHWMLPLDLPAECHAKRKPSRVPMTTSMFYCESPSMSPTAALAVIQPFVNFGQPSGSFPHAFAA